MILDHSISWWFRWDSPWESSTNHPWTSKRTSWLSICSYQELSWGECAAICAYDRVRGPRGCLSVLNSSISSLRLTRS